MPRLKSRTNDDDWIANLTEMSFLLGISTQTLKSYTDDQGCPFLPPKRYPVRAVIRWALARAAGDGEELALDNPKATAEARTLFYREQTRKLTIDNERALRHMITMDEAGDFFRTMTQQLVDAFESIPSRIDTDPETRRRLEQAVARTRVELAEDLDAAFSTLESDPADTDSAT